MLTYLIIGILVQVIWSTLSVFVLKLETIEGLKRMSLGDWFVLIGSMAVNVFVWPGALLIDIGIIVNHFNEKES